MKYTLTVAGASIFPFKLLLIRSCFSLKSLPQNTREKGLFQPTAKGAVHLLPKTQIIKIKIHTGERKEWANNVLQKRTFCIVIRDPPPNPFFILKIGYCDFSQKDTLLPPIVSGDHNNSGLLAMGLTEDVIIFFMPPPIQFKVCAQVFQFSISK